jgi:hypothetical protein
MAAPFLCDDAGRGSEDKRPLGVGAGWWMACWRVAAGQTQTGGFLLLTRRFLGTYCLSGWGYTKTWLQIPFVVLVRRLEGFALCEVSGDCALHSELARC